MPQMSPLWWLMLFLTFSITLIIFIFLNYFSTINFPDQTEQNVNITHQILPWKW